MRFRLLVLTLSLVLIAAGSTWAGAPGLVINEVRIDQTGADNDEYFELFGTPGVSLDGLTYLVIGDGTTGSGTIEAVVDLTGSALDANGYFVAAESTFTIGLADLVTTLNFENSDNVTHLLVQGFVGADGDDLDVDDDCVLDVTPWAAIVDSIALIEEPNPAAGTECEYSSLGAGLGPDGVNVPGHAKRCPNGGPWAIGAFDPAAGDDTPGAANDCSIPGDDCSDAMAIGDGDTAYSTIGATTDGPAPCGSLGADVWFSYTATCTGDLTLSTCDQADYDTAIAIYDAAVPCPPMAGDEIGCNDDGAGCAGGTSTLTVAVTEGSTYLIQVGGAAGAQGGGTLSLSCVGSMGGLDIRINEIRIDQPGNDDDEYFELFGPAGQALDGLTYIVIGDGTGGSGVVEAVVSLAGQSIGASGFFLAAETTFTLGTPDLVADLNF
ncbi:MAG: hypothetical protein KDC38_19940, partial [Planctomycetes bacterium]|nr:hypothetical protein [Planctomycetota bacterium]